MIQLRQSPAGFRQPSSKKKPSKNSDDAIARLAVGVVKFIRHAEIHQAIVPNVGQQLSVATNANYLLVIVDDSF